MTSLYSLRSTPVKGEFLITKFDRDYNPEVTYALTRSECSCPRSHKTGCRHRTMLPLFQQTNRINDGWFLDFDTRLWRKPLSEVMLSTADAGLSGALSLAVKLGATVEERLAKSFESEGSSLCAPAGPPELAQADLTAAGIETERETERFEKRAVEIGMSKAQGELLMKAHKGDAAALKKLEDVLKGLHEQITTGKLFAEFGSANAGAVDAYDEITAKAEVLRKAEPKLTIEKAKAKVIEDPANADLMKRYREEQRQKINKAA